MENSLSWDANSCSLSQKNCQHFIEPNVSLTCSGGLPRVSILKYLQFKQSHPMKNAVFWDAALCRPCVNKRFGGTYRLHLKGRNIRERGTRFSGWLQINAVSRSSIFLPWRWRRYVPPKRRLMQDLHSATSYKTTFFIVTAVKTSNLTQSHPSLRFVLIIFINVDHFY
jgi:hypothetical protein